MSNLSSKELKLIIEYCTKYARRSAEKKILEVEKDLNSQLEILKEKNESIKFIIENNEPEVIIGPNGSPGTDGLDGENGKDFTFEMFTESQLNELRGEDGTSFTYDMFTEEQIESLKGIDGTSFTYDMFTEEQLEKFKGSDGINGKDFTYDMFSEEQIESLKGPSGNDGIDGKDFTFEDFTVEQIESLKGPNGKDFVFEMFSEEQIELLRGPVGKDFVFEMFSEEQIESLKGIDGKDFTFDMFSEEQIEMLKGFDGVDGKDFTYDMFSEEQIESLKGSSGSDGINGKDFTFEDLTVEQIESLKGPAGKDFTFEMFTESQLNELRGEDGTSFTYDLFTEEQIESLKGPQGEPFKWEDLTESQKMILKGPRGDKGFTGDKGDPLIWEDLTETNKNELKLKPTDMQESDWDRLIGPQGPIGPHGPALMWEDLTETNKNELKLKPEHLNELDWLRLKGDKGDSGLDGKDFTFGMFSEEQLKDLHFTWEDLTEEAKKELKGIKGPIGKMGPPGPIGEKGKDAIIDYSKVIEESAAKAYIQLEEKLYDVKALCEDMRSFQEDSSEEQKVLNEEFESNLESLTLKEIEEVKKEVKKEITRLEKDLAGKFNTSQRNILASSGGGGSDSPTIPNIPVQASAPLGPTIGDLWYDTGLFSLKIYSAGGIWNATGSAGISPNSLPIMGTVNETADKIIIVDSSANQEKTLSIPDARNLILGGSSALVKTVNGNAPDLTGNVAISITATFTGTEAQRIAKILPDDGDVWIVTGDVTPANDGKVYIYSTQDDVWHKSASLDITSADARYLQLTGGTLTGNLILDHDPVLNLEPVTKQYYDANSIDVVRSAGNPFFNGTNTGDFYFDTTDHLLYNWNGSSWDDLKINYIGKDNTNLSVTSSSGSNGTFHFTVDSVTNIVSIDKDNMSLDDGVDIIGGTSSRIFFEDAYFDKITGTGSQNSLNISANKIITTPDDFQIGDIFLDNANKTIRAFFPSDTLTLGGKFKVNSDFDLDSNKLINVATPTIGTDGVNKDYVDSKLGARISVVANEASLPASPLNDDLVITRDKRQFFIYNSTQWIQII